MNYRMPYDLEIKKLNMWWGKGLFNFTYSVFPIIQCFLPLRLSPFSIFLFLIIWIIQVSQTTL